MQYCFNWGFFYGFVSAVVLGLVWNQVQKARGSIKQMSKPLDTIPDAYQPKTTSWGVVKKSVLSLFSLVFWLPVLMSLVVVIFWSMPHFRVSLGCG